MEEFREDFKIFVEAVHSKNNDRQKAYVLLNLAGRDAIEKARSFIYHAAWGESKEKVSTFMEKFESMCSSQKPYYGGVCI